jgi:hypothetical protein
MHSSFPMRAACPAHAILLDVITMIMFGEEQKLFSFSLPILSTYFLLMISKFIKP